jgi:hypothetical protein
MSLGLPEWCGCGNPFYPWLMGDCVPSSADESIASVDANGLITAHQTGHVTISVVHLETPVVTQYSALGTPYSALSTQSSVIGQSDVALNVQVAQLTDNDPNTATPQAIIVSAKDGAAASADTGETVLIGAGALAQDAAVSISRIDINNLQAETGMAAPAPGMLNVAGAFNLNLGDPIYDSDREEHGKVVTDWSTKPDSSFFDDDDARKAIKSNSNWLADFLGVDKGVTKQDAASLSKLVVTLDKGDTKGR